MKRNFIKKTLTSLLIIGTCMINLTMPILATDGGMSVAIGWINCDTTTSNETFMHPWAYKYSDGTAAHDGWYFIDNNWYYFKGNTIVYGEQEINGKWYFFDYRSGKLLMNQYAPVGSHAEIWADENGVLQY
jgi:hypothetical protein